MKQFTVLTLNWNGKEVLPDMIESLSQQIADLKGNLIVFDNNSTDGSDKDALSIWGKEDWFSLIRSTENLGFAGGANHAIKEIDAEIIVLANSDTVFLPGSLERLLESLQSHPEAGIIGPKLLWPDGSLQPSLRDFPFPGNLIKEHLPFLNRKSAIKSLHDKAQFVDWLVGAVMVFRRDVFLDIGGFNDDFFFYHEETELQYRLFESGYRSFFEPEAVVIHVEGASARKMFGRETYLKYIKAKFMFLDKHGYFGSKLLFRLFMGGLQLSRLFLGFVSPALSHRDIRFTAQYCRKALGELFSHN